MSPIEQFWWNWGIQCVVAIATLMAVSVALFGDWIKARLFQPRLELSLKATRGESTVATLQAPNGDVRQECCRMYHVTATNKVKWPQATHVQVLLTRLEEFGPDGLPQVKWTGDVPMRWRHQEIYPFARTIGPAADCDLLSVVRAKWLELHPILVPNNLPARRGGKANFVVVLQARSNEARSPILRNQVSWDGEWEDGEVEMSRHLTVRVVGSEPNDRGA